MTFCFFVVFPIAIVAMLAGADGEEAITARVDARVVGVSWKNAYGSETLCYSELIEAGAETCTVTLALMIKVCGLSLTDCVTEWSQEWVVSLKADDFDHRAFSKEIETLTARAVEENFNLGDVMELVNYDRKHYGFIDCYMWIKRDGETGSDKAHPYQFGYVSNTLTNAHPRYYMFNAIFHDIYWHRLNLNVSMALICGENHYGCNCHRECKKTDNYDCTNDGYKKCALDKYPESFNLRYCDHDQVCTKHCSETDERLCGECGNSFCNLGHFKNGSGVCVQRTCSQHEQLCGENGVCVNQSTVNYRLDGFYTCNCSAGYTGRRCEDLLPTTVVPTPGFTTKRSKTTKEPPTARQVSGINSKTNPPTGAPFPKTNRIVQPTAPAETGGGASIGTICAVLAVALVLVALVGYVGYKVYMQKRVSTPGNVGVAGSGDEPVVEFNRDEIDRDTISIDRLSLSNPLYEEGY